MDDASSAYAQVLARLTSHDAIVFLDGVLIDASALRLTASRVRTVDDVYLRLSSSGTVVDLTHCLSIVTSRDG